jgi:hypothetical protein
MADVETFVIRLTKPAPEADGMTADELRGVIEHLRLKQSRPFRGSDQLLELLTDGLAARQASGRQQHTWKED